MRAAALPAALSGLGRQQAAGSTACTQVHEAATAPWENCAPRNLVLVPHCVSSLNCLKAAPIILCLFSVCSKDEFMELLMGTSLPDTLNQYDPRIKLGWAQMDEALEEVGAAGCWVGWWS